MADVLDGLTEAQREAVLYGAGPLLVVAGAGSGKTRVITRRVAYLASAGVAPHRLLAITFTNKAADEMKHRIVELSGVRGAWVSTFHSLCARILRQFSDLLGFQHPFTIYDRADQLACVKLAMHEMGLTEKSDRPHSFLSGISRAKNDMQTPDEVAGQSFRSEDRAVADVFRAYQNICRANNALDFDDLLVETARLLRDNADFRSYWQSRFEYILIDEYQDTNRPQYIIARELAAGHRNICATGDPDQSIYAWRGADIQNILDFKKDYPDAHVVKLEENFRSTKMILAAASGVIERNRARIKRGLWTRNDTGVPVQVVEAGNDVGEADAVVAGIQAGAADGVPFGNMAIFYRTHAQSRTMEDSLRDAGVPYQILDAVEFYNRKEIKDVVGYLKAIVNPADGVSIARIINEPRRGIGDKTLIHVRAYAAAQSITLTEALESAAQIPGCSEKTAEKLAAFAEMMRRLREVPRAPVADVVRAVLRETQYIEQMRKTKTEEDAARAENLNEFVNAAASFDTDYPEAKLEHFLERISLVSDSDSMESEQGRVIMMTLHSAKGLEFDHVFIVGVQEGLLPHMNSLGSTSRVEEERRLFYVGITRARKRLCLHWAAERLTYGMAGTSEPSRFIREIPATAKAHGSRMEPDGEAMDAQQQQQQQQQQSSAPGTAERVIEYDEEHRPGAAGAATRSRTPAGAVSGAALRGSGLAEGDRVRHATLGDGRVISISGSGERLTAVIDFSSGRRHLMLRYASLKRIG